MASDDNLDDIPPWDVALAALAREEYLKLSNPLTIEDFRRLATEHSIRFDDIMATMFELVIQDEWQYEGRNGRNQPVTREAINKLYVQGRLNEADVSEYIGDWRPGPV